MMARTAIWILIGAMALTAASGCRRIRPPMPASAPAKVKAPATGPATSQATTGPTYIMYTIRPGDTLGRIAGTVMGNRANARLIERANPGLDPTKLTVGQVIKVPVLKKRTPATAPAR